MNSSVKLPNLIDFYSLQPVQKYHLPSKFAVAFAIVSLHGLLHFWHSGIRLIILFCMSHTKVESKDCVSKKISSWWLKVRPMAFVLLAVVASTKFPF